MAADGKEVEDEEVVPLIKVQHESLLVLRWKVAMVGDAAVGKSALAKMVESNGAEFPSEYHMTVGTEIRVKPVKVKGAGGEGAGEGAGEGVLVELYLLDGGGQAIFNQREFGTTLWPSANAVVVVFDVSSRESFTSCSKWLRRFADVRPGKALVGAVVANKTDLERDGRRVISKEEGQEFAASVGLQYLETSAKEGVGIDEPFERIAAACYKAYEDRAREIEEMG